MSDYELDSPWGAPSAPPTRTSSELAPSQGNNSATEPEHDISASDVLEKEQLVKEVITRQEGLRALLDRVEQVQAEGAKLRSDNETLQTYIDNLTRTNAMAAGAGR